MPPARTAAADSLAVVVRFFPILLLVAAAGCGYFETDEAHLAPRTPLLPPTSEALGGASPLTTPSPAPTATPPPEAGADVGVESQQSAGNGAPGEADPGDGDESSEAPGDEPEANSEEPQRLEIIVVGELSHDPAAFTQGLEIFDGRLYESTGAPGDRASSIRELDRETGEMLRLEEIEDDLFAEGLTFVDGAAFQLTWQDGVAFVWDPADFTVIDDFSYEGQGWGLCFNGRVLVMSDGSAELHFRDPVTFERVGNPVLVTLDGKELPSLNELECFRDPQISNLVYANVWQTDLIVQIDIVTGRVLAVADASAIGLPRSDDPNAVLNGIAWDPDTETFLITGKDWPAMYEVYFEAAGAPNGDPAGLDP